MQLGMNNVIQWAARSDHILVTFDIDVARIFAAAGALYSDLKSWRPFSPQCAHYTKPYKILPKPAKLNTAPSPARY